MPAASFSPRILFITSNRVGDAVLTTGILSWLLDRQPQARLTVACGPVAQDLFENIPQLERLIPMEKGRWSAHWRRLWQACVGTRWDLVVDIRHSLFSYLVPARRRAVFSPSDQPVHKLIQLARCLGAEPPPLPRLWLSEEQKTEAQRLIPAGTPVLAVGPTANWAGKQWPAQRFSELVSRLTAAGGLLPGARVAVFGGPGEREAAAPVLEAVPAERCIDLVGRNGLNQAAACLERCALYIGNDSGLMHLAGAAGVPTIGLFGPSREEVYGPFGDNALAVRTHLPYRHFEAEQVFRQPRPLGLMDGIEVERVISAADWLIKHCHIVTS
ncbi:MAG TPA: glycosyltransferase family 9 protein [Candidatus Sulfotelmatobacter sp.]|nr:glycosyltransferase family 9 protein [Candidatus Sulfotelmatobacter sp.]